MLCVCVYVCVCVCAHLLPSHRPLLTAFVDGCGWDIAENAPTDESNTPPGVADLLRVFEEANKAMLAEADYVASDLIERARSRLQSGADGAETLRMAGLASELLKLYVDGETDTYKIEQAQVCV